MKWHVLFLFLAIALFLPSLSSAGESVIGVSLMPLSPVFKSFADYRESIWGDSVIVTAKIMSTELEIRFPQEKLRIARLPYTAYLSTLVPNGSIDACDDRPLSQKSEDYRRIPESQLHLLGTPRPGEYRIALYVNGVRASNVASFRIDPNFDESKIPVLQVGSVEPNPRQTQGMPALFVHGPTPKDPTLTNNDLDWSPIIIDGQVQKQDILEWEGQVHTIGPGEFYGLPLRLSGFGLSSFNGKQDFDPNKPHLISMKFGRYTSNSYYFDPSDDHLNREWDAMTPQIKDAPGAP
jgi:hypothetical protein